MGFPPCDGRMSVKSTMQAGGLLLPDMSSLTLATVLALAPQGAQAASHDTRRMSTGCLTQMTLGPLFHLSADLLP